MSFQYKQNDSTSQYDDPSMPKLTMRHSPYSSRLSRIGKSLFSSKDISQQTEPYDICCPGHGTGDAMLTMQNPPLLAFRNKTNIPRPDVVSPNSKLKQPFVPAISLLVKRPLTALKDPEIHALDVVKKQVEQEKMTIDFSEDPIAYFSKRKDGRGHRFIYLVNKGDPNDISYSPYDLEKVPFAEIKGDYFTMSASGVTHVFPDGNTETMSLDLWAMEKSIFNSVRKLKIFAQFFYWKPFRIWKNFVMHQRYHGFDNTITVHPFYKNKEFFSRALFLNYRQAIARELLLKYLLAFQSQRKFRLEEFEATNRASIEYFKSKWEKFIMKTQNEIQQLYTTISNPKLVQVHDSDFPDIKGRNPNLAQLMVLEKRKAAKRQAKTEAVNRQIIEIGGFIRMIDYMLLETLQAGCIEAFKLADANVSSEQAAVFVVDVIYDDEGKVAFTPTLEKLIDSIKTILNDSLKVLNLLPRLLMQLPMKPFLRDNGLDYITLFEDGPQFIQMVDRSILDEARDHIIEVVTKSYNEGFEFSQSFSSFYSIHKMGQTWNVYDYLITPNNEKFTGTLNEDLSQSADNDDFLLNPDEQPLIDIERVSNDIIQYREDVKKIENMRNSAVRGALFIDSRGLKSNLGPVPDTALKELQEMLSQLATLKKEKTKNALRFYSRKLKQDPQTLDEYVVFCEILERCQKTTPQIEKEIEFVDKLFEMMDKFDFPHEENSNHTLFIAFTVDKRNANNKRTEHLGIFTDALKTSLTVIEAKINKFMEKATSIPATIRDTDVKTLIPAAKKLCTKIESIQPKVNELQQQQQIISVNLNDFKAYENVKIAAAFSVKLYEAIEKWNELSTLMSTVPFKKVNPLTFRQDVEALKESSSNLQDSAPNNYPIISELSSKIQDVFPYVDQIEQLSKGQMQTRHWNMLFEICGQRDKYHENITIQELLNLGILHAKDKIEQITKTSQGESQLEGEFNEILNYWNKVQMPFVESPVKVEDNLLLGPTASLLREIQDALATLTRIISVPYVQAIRDDVSHLISNLENFSLIIEAWQLFQSNWVILSALFDISEARNILPHQTNKFSVIQKKWNNIARYTLKDTRLFNVCAYPNLLEVLRESNSAMEQITSSLGKFLDARRLVMPRLFFLGNDEVLTLITTSNCERFVSILSKIFMQIEKIDCHEKDNGEGEAGFTSNNIQKLKIYGLVGNDGDSIQFQRYLQCAGPMEVWMAQLVETMKTTVKDAIGASIPGCQSGSFIDWVMTTPTYIAFIVLNIVFCNEMEDCFASYESNPKAFQTYEGTLKRRIEDTMDSFLLPLSRRDELKLQTILTQLLGFRDRFRLATEKLQNYSPYLEWLNSLRFKYIPNSSSVSVEYSDFKWDHGYEYWGKVPNLIHTPQTDVAISDCVYSFSQGQLPMIASSAASGKKIIGSTLGALFGLFSYIVRPFPDMTEYFLSRIMTGAASTGGLIVFSGIEQLKPQSLCYLYDSVYSIMAGIAAGNPRITISQRLSDLNKNCKIMFTSCSNYKNCENIPHQLKSTVRPISLLAPNYSKIIEVYLTAIGFRERKVLAPKLANFVKSIQLLLNSNYSAQSTQKTSQSSVASASLNARIISIIRKANEMIHKMRSSLSEEMALAVYSYESCLAFCDEPRIKVIQKLLFNSFQIANSIESMMEKINAIKKETVEEEFREIVEKEVSALSLELPKEYITNQVVSLFNLMQQYNCIVIAGPPNSGKSTVLDILQKVFDLDEIKEYFPDELKIKINPLFHLSDKWGHIFGDIYDDPNEGVMYAYGQIHSAIYDIMKKENYNNIHQILKFDGKLTRSFSTFLSELFGTPDLNKLMLNSLDSFNIDNSSLIPKPVPNSKSNPNLKSKMVSLSSHRHFHIIIETDKLDRATPSLLSKCGILIMKNKQSDIPFTIPCELTHPIIPFARALKICHNCIQEANIPIIQSVFCEVSPHVVNRVFHLKNYVCSTETTSNLDNGFILISEIMPMYCAILAMTIIKEKGVNQTDEFQVRNCLIHSFARICNGIMYPEHRSTLNDWLCQQYSIDLPKDWVGFTVSTSFSDYFAKPTLYSMRINKGEFIPLGSSDLEKPAIFKKREIGMDQELLPLFVDEVSVIHPQILPPLYIAKYLLLARQNILIYGSHDSGKSSFLPILFSEMSNMVPIVIKASQFLTGEPIYNYLKTHTQILSKSQSLSILQKHFILVFDGLETKHKELIEFIRMILITHKIPLFSPNDQKVFEFIGLTDFSIIVTTRNFKGLPNRFLSHFAPIALDPITETTASFIGNKLLQTYGFKENLSHKLMNTAMIALSQFPHMSVIHNVASICSSLCFIDDKNDTELAVKCLLSELYYTSLHKYNLKDFVDKITHIFKADFADQSKVVNYFLAFKDLQYPSFDIIQVDKEDSDQNQAPSSDDAEHLNTSTSNTICGCSSLPELNSIKSIRTFFNPHPINELQEELAYYLKIFNASSIEKLDLRFTSVTTRQWALVYRSLTRPGQNVILTGKESSGRYIISRFVAHMIESDFIFISPSTPDELLSNKYRESGINSLLKDAIKNAINLRKKSVIYIRATNGNEKEVRLLADFATKFSFQAFFNRKELSELYEKVFSTKPATSYQYENTKQMIISLLRLCIHVIINKSSNLNYPIHYSKFDEIAFDSDNDENYESIISLAFNTSHSNNQNEKSSLSLFDIRKVITTQEGINRIQKFLPRIPEVARRFTHTFCPNKFYDFVDTFYRYLEKDFQNLEKKNNNIISALKFVKILQQELSDINDNLSSLSPKLEKIQIDCDSLQASYNTRKEAIEIRRTKLEQDHKEKQEEIEKLKNDLAEHEKELNVLQPQCDQVYSEVEKLTDNDIETIRITAAEPQPPLRLIMEMICIFLDLTPSYELSGQKLLMGPQFIPTLIGKIHGNKVSKKTLDEVQPYLNNEEMDPQKLEAIAPALRILYDWLNSLCQLEKLNEDLEKEKAFIDEKTRQLDEFVEEMNLEFTSIEQVEKALESESQALTDANNKKQDMQNEYDGYNKKKKLIEQIFKDIDVLTNKWEEESNKFTSKCGQLVGNSILFSFYLVFCGSLPMEERKTSLQEVLALLMTSGIKTSYEDPFQSISDRFLALSINENVQHDNLQIDAHHAELCIRTPLILDPDGIVYNLYTNSISSKKLVAVSQSVSNLEQYIASAIQDGKVLVLTDVDYLHPLVSSILTLVMQEPDQSMSMNIKVGSKLVTWDPKFKLVLFSRKAKLKSMPMSLLSRVTIIDITGSSLDSTQAAFEKAFIDYFDPELSPKLLEMKKEVNGHRVQKMRYEMDTLDILADIIATKTNQPEYDILADETSINDLIKSKDCYLNAMNSTPDFSATKRRYRNMIEPFKKHIQLCQIFWKVMSRDLPYVNNSACYSFSLYIKQISNVMSSGGLHPGVLSADQHSALHQSIINSTFQFLFQTLPFNDILFFLFMATYSLKESNKILQKSDLQAVLEHITLEYNKSADLHAEDVAVGDNFEHLKFSNIVYLFKYITKFISEQFGEEYQNFIPHFQFDSIITSAASIPSVIIANDEVNPAALIQYFVALRTRYENLSIVSLCDDLETIRNTRKLIMTSMTRGNWIVAHYSQPSKATASMLTDIYTQMTTTTINTGFRLILIASTTAYLSISMLLKAKRVNVETFPSIKHSMLSIFQHHSASIRSTTNLKAMKKLAYISALLISIVQFRNFVTPVGFSNSVRLSPISFRDFLEQLRVIIDAHPNDIPLRNFRYQIKTLICSCVESPHDRKIISAHAASMIKQDALEDGFTITPRTHERSIWAVPNDIPLSNFNQIIQQIPTFTSTDILHMSSQILLNWNLSIWAIQPFIKYSRQRNEIDFQASLARLDNFVMLMPEKLEINEPDKFLTPMGLYLASEVERLNLIINYIKNELLILSKQYKKGVVSPNGYDFANGNVPKQWAQQTFIINFVSLNAFTSHIIERHAQLMRCLQEVNPAVYDMRLLEYPDQLLKSFLIHCAVEDNLHPDTLTYQFSIVDGTPPSDPRSLFLTRLHLANGNYVDDKLTIDRDPNKPPFTQLTAVVAKVVNKSSKRPKTFAVPMFKNALISSMDFHDSALSFIQEGESNNFVYDVKLPTDLPENELAQFGTMIFCRMPEQFL